MKTSYIFSTFLLLLFVFASCSDDCECDNNPVKTFSYSSETGGSFSSVFSGALDFNAKTVFCTYESHDIYDGKQLRIFTASGSDGHDYCYKLSFELKDDASKMNFNIADTSEVASFYLAVYDLEDEFNSVEYYLLNPSGYINCSKLNDSEIVATIDFSADLSYDSTKSVEASGSLNGYYFIITNH